MALAGVATAADKTGADLSDLITSKITESGYTAAGDFTYEISFTLTGDIPYIGGNGDYIMELENGYYFLSSEHKKWGLSASSNSGEIDGDTFTFSSDDNN